MDENIDMPSLEDIENQLSSREQENQYLKSRNFGLQDAAESNFMPKNDANVIEYKLSSEELLERIEHYLRGDVLKTRVNEDKQVETYYSIPTKKISVSIYRNEENGRIYLVDEHPPGQAEWDVVSIFEKEEGEQVVETILENNYKPLVLSELKEGLKKSIELTKKVGKKIVKSKKNKITYLGVGSKEIPDESRRNLSEYGVQEVMNILSMYITKETFLSWYKEERIYEILGDIGDQLNKFFFINGKLLGLDSEYKKTKYPMIVVTILHNIENAYRRALLGSENKGTREGIIITQHQPMAGGNNYGGMQVQKSQKKRWNPFDKNTW